MSAINAKPLIIIAEDHKDTALVLSRLLESEGYATRIANNGGELFKLMRNEKPRLIFLDIQMPWMDGTEVLLKLKSEKDTAGIPVIICTGEDGIKEVQKYINWGAFDHITKPFDNDAVCEKVRKILKS